MLLNKLVINNDYLRKKISEYEANQELDCCLYDKEYKPIDIENLYHYDGVCYTIDSTGITVLALRISESEIHGSTNYSSL